MVCRRCGAAQSPADEQWFHEIEEIYSKYYAYHQAGGAEQHVFDPPTGLLRRRSDVLLDNLLSLTSVPHSGKVLDIGCAQGSTLKAFAARGGWRLFGSELDDRNLPYLSRIGGFEALYTCRPADLPGGFDLITMIHALEHFPDPLSALCELRPKIAPQGKLFVQVPNAAMNPFDYLIADHMLHLSPATLASLSVAAGFHVEHLAQTWVAKELSLTAHPISDLGPETLQESAPEAAQRITGQIAWLRRFIDTAAETAKETRAFGLFGSSIAATWLCYALEERVAFFVDQDPNRIGRTHMGRPVLSPKQAPCGSVVFLSVVPTIAERIAEQLRGIGIDLRLPPPYPCC